MLWIGDYQGMYEGFTQAGLNYLMALKTVGFEDVDVLPLSGLWADRMPPWAAPLLKGDKFGMSREPCIIHTLPTNLPAIRLGGPRRTGFVTFETDRLPKWIARELNRVTVSLIVPCEFNHEGLLAAGYKNPIHVVPHTVGRWWWETALEPSQDRPFTFTYVGTWVPRKNAKAILRAYLDAFPVESEYTCLVLKIVAAAGYKEQIKALVGDRTDIHVFDEVWSERQVQWLHVNTDCFVSAHKGEGWGLGPFQAKLIGRPVIYTDWSAVREFCSPVYGDLPVVCDIYPVEAGMESMPMYAEPEGVLHWANPRHEALVEAMRDVQHGFGERTILAKMAAEGLRNRFCWETVGANLRDTISKL